MIRMQAVFNDVLEEFIEVVNLFISSFICNLEFIS